MQSQIIRQKFLSFFESKHHKIVSSAPMVVKNDPTLLFTNAGMNQFKEIFLDHVPITFPRIADTQKCLRVSGKHNDLEEVGHDTYHHTMFEMLGNWSFGDYFKEEAIAWAFELLTEVYGIDKGRLYATVFEGSSKDQLAPDTESHQYWQKYLPQHHILNGSAKDNFWEMGETGPCGPCTEIHIDLRTDEERKKIDGAKLVNTGSPVVVELWNLVFIQYNRKNNGQLEPLTHRHVDTGMGFERLCMVLQGKQSNYDTDVFTPIIAQIEKNSGKSYTENPQTSVAMRVIADHIRAISFAIADGQLPSNVKAGYVIRRILRRAVRYGYTFLEAKEPFLYKLVEVLRLQMGEIFPELQKQQSFIENVIREEERAFFQTLDNGIKLLSQTISGYKQTGKTEIDSHTLFTLYDTYGFPIDLTELIAQEEGFSIDKAGFEKELLLQKNRSKQDAETSSEEWTVLLPHQETEFVGYDQFSSVTQIVKYRKVERKQQTHYQIVLTRTPFYAEGGGQVGDMGTLFSSAEKVDIINTLKENGVVVHITTKIPQNVNDNFTAQVDEKNRKKIAANHTATHLLHYALRQVLGNHVEQKGSLVSSQELRFDFSHFQKIGESDISSVQQKVNELIRQNYHRIENRSASLKEATKEGAMALFGEKYTDKVRTVRFGDSFELCGGTHVEATGNIGYFRIVSEGSIATGIRRIVAVTGLEAERMTEFDSFILNQIKQFLNNNDVQIAVKKLMEENTSLRKSMEQAKQENLNRIVKKLYDDSLLKGDTRIVRFTNHLPDPEMLRNIALHMIAGEEKILFIGIATIVEKVFLAIGLSKSLLNEVPFNAQKLITQYAPQIEGKGGGQPHFAIAGGKTAARSQEIIEQITSLIH